MIVVDSSVWIDYFNGRSSRETDLLDTLLVSELVLTGDIILAEVLQGFRTEAGVRQAIRLFDPLPYADMLGRKVAIEAASHYRTLRRKGVTIRKLVDVLIAAFCIHGGHSLLHSDRDFEALEEHCGLRTL